VKVAAETGDIKDQMLKEQKEKELLLKQQIVSED
jgi:hypothetical protein